MRTVTVYHASGCHLCSRALEVVDEVGRETQFELELVDIEGDPELETRFRELLPVIEVDGVRTFTYFVTAAGLREALARAPA